MTATILVTGAGDPVGASLARQLAARGYTVVAADLAPTVDLPERVHQLPAATDPGFLDALLRLARRAQADLVIPTVTEELMVVATYLEGEHPAYPRFVVSPLVTLVAANDTLRTCQVLAAVGVDVPAFSVPSRALASPAAAHALGMPFLSKPRVGRGGRGCAVHDGTAERTRAELEAMADSMILQELAPGEEFATNVYLTGDPARDVVVVLRKTELKGGRIGTADSVERAEHSDVAAVALAAARALCAAGPLEVDVRLRADGTPVVLSVNARFGAHSAHAPEVLDALLVEHLGVRARLSADGDPGSAAMAI